MKLHHRFGHISFKRLQEMAKQGTVPMRLAKCPIPLCTACMFAKATKQKWRDKTRLAGDEVEKVSRPGQVVSVDQMVSPTPGLIAQMTGFLTSKRYKYATVYVDQYSRHGFVYLRKTASAEETLKGKITFEMHAQSHGVRVDHYHADNGILKARAWVDACRQAGQGLTFAAVGAHHQTCKENGVNEFEKNTLKMEYDLLHVLLFQYSTISLSPTVSKCKFTTLHKSTLS